MQEDLRETSARLEATQAKKEAIGQELEVTKQQLAEEVAAHGTTHEQLAATRMQLHTLQEQYLLAQDELEAERERSNQLQKVVDQLQQRLESLQRLRQQQNEVALQQRLQWEQQLQKGKEEQQDARAALDELQQEYFAACEWSLGCACAGRVIGLACAGLRLVCRTPGAPASRYVWSVLSVVLSAECSPGVGALTPAFPALLLLLLLQTSAWTTSSRVCRAWRTLWASWRRVWRSCRSWRYPRHHQVRNTHQFKRHCQGCQG